MPTNEERTYPNTATCDGCAEGPKPVRSDGDAHVCEDCDRRHGEACVAASERLARAGVGYIPPHVVSEVVVAYHAAYDEEVGA